MLVPSVRGMYNPNRYVKMVKYVGNEWKRLR